MKRNISKISSSVILAVLFVFIGDCRPGDEDPEDGSSLAQILMVSNINGSVWHGRPLWNSCEYTPGSITGISSCLVFENAYTKLYNSEPHNMSVVLTLNGAAVEGKILILLPDFNLSPFQCEISVAGSTFYNPFTEITALSLSQVSPCISPSGNTVNLIKYNSHIYSDNQNGSAEFDLIDAPSSDRIKMGFVFEISKVI